MESITLLSLLAVLVITPVSLECIDGNCTDPVPVFRLNIGSIFPFFGPVDFDGERDREPLNDAIDPKESPSNESDASGGVISIRIMEVFSIRDPSQSLDGLGQPSGDDKMPLLQGMFDSILADIGLLDLSGKNMTSAEVYAALRARKEEGRPVTTLILSNIRIHPMDSGTFAIAEGTINTLVMDNTTVNLDALRGLTNLKVLNLSNNALTTFPWYGLMSTTLEVLDLSNNKYEEIRPELSMLKNLRELYLSNNKIMFVEATPLNMLPNLETLDLSMNMLLRANFASLSNLNRLNVDWNFLRLMGTDCQLPFQPLSLKLASNPWRCDCGLLRARDANEILDLDKLQCVMNRNNYEYNYCPGCPRPFLPDQDGLRADSLTLDSIGHHGCRDIPELYNYLSHEYVKLRDNEPKKLAQDIVLFVTLIVFLMFCVFVTIKTCSSQRTGSKIWLRAQEIPKWSFEKLGKSQEVPYIKIDEKIIKA